MSDPYFNQNYARHDLRFKRHDEFPPPADPTLVAAARGGQHKNAATGYTLYHQSAMPAGVHAGKTMERVPAEYLLRMAGSAAGGAAWQAVKDYVKRHLAEITARI